ncbi:methionine import ATP-binding protein MetN, putative [gamma proteobacterium HTCC5015]|nr:methionine import ATP-binding protein MetN, putative [gamma proteobacterium HTCC5015]
MVVKSILRCAFEDLSVYTPRGLPLLQSVNLELPMGEVVEVTGEHGAGKSVVLKLLAGLVRPVSGAVVYNNENVSALNFESFLPYRRNIGYGYGDRGLLSAYSLEENFLLPMRYHPLLDDDTSVQRVSELLDGFGLSAVKHLRPGQMSESFKRLAIVARAMLFRPQLLLLDNPTTGLPDEDRERIIQLIQREREMHRLRHVFLVSKDMPLIDALVTKRIHIEHQQLVAVPSDGREPEYAS